MERIKENAYEELHNVYISPNIRTRTTRIRVAKYIAGMGQIKCIQNYVGKLESKTLFKDLGVDEF
jgi:hypothetical protein